VFFEVFKITCEVAKMEALAFLDKGIIGSILAKTAKPLEKSLKIISFSELYRLLNEQENHLIRCFLKLNPRDFGFKGKFIGVGAVPRDLVSINREFLPRPVFSAFLRMNRALENDTGRRLAIFSSYRSPAYQAIVFLRCLKENGFDFLKTAKGVAFPGYSEHGDPINLAIDFCTTNGDVSNIGPINFEKTVEFDWLMKNGDVFGFSLSYPENNGDGIMFEPWHWRFKV